MSDKPQNKAKSTDRVEDKALEKPSTNPEVAKESQADAKGQKKIELQRTNKHDGSAGKSDQGDIESVRIESIDEHGNKKVASRKDGGSEQDLLLADRPAGGFDEVHSADGGITLKGVIPGPGEELENITTGTMEALSSENALVQNALEMRRQIDQHMEPGPEKDKVVRQLKADVTASLMSGEIGENEIGGTHKAITDNTSDINSEMPEKAEQDWLSVMETVSKLPLDKQFQIIGSGLKAGLDQYHHDERERTWGTMIGTVQGVGEVATNLAKVADFGAALILGDKERAYKAGEEFGEALGQTIVGGVKLFDASHQYLYNIGFTGDYAKPFRDLAILGHALNQKWSELPPREQERVKAKLVAELLADGVITAGGAAMIKKAPKFTGMLETIASEAKELPLANKLARLKASKATQEAIDEVSEPLSKNGLKRSKSDVLPSTNRPDKAREVPFDPIECQKEFDRIADEIRKAWVDLPENIQEKVIRGHLGGRVEIVESMHKIAEVMKHANIPMEEYERLAGAVVTNAFIDGEYAGDALFMALSTYNRPTNQWLLVDDAGGIFRHEVSHVIDKLQGKSGQYFSDGPEFLKAFNQDVSRLEMTLSKSDLDELTKNHLLNSSKAKRELFAQVQAMKLGGCSFPTMENLIKEAYPSVCNLIFSKE